MSIHEENQRMRNLFKAILVTAFLDANDVRDKRNNTVKAEVLRAREFLLIDNKDLRIICDAADLEVSNVIAAARMRERQGWPKMSMKQFKRFVNYEPWNLKTIPKDPNFPRKPRWIS